MQSVGCRVEGFNPSPRAVGAPRERARERLRLDRSFGGLRFWSLGFGNRGLGSEVGV